MSRRGIIGLVAALVLAAMAGPVVIALGADRGSAAFGDNETFGINQLESASVELAVGENSVAIDATSMAPGDRVGGQIVIENKGSLPLRYALVADLSAPDQTLRGSLDWKIWPTPSAASCSAPIGPFLFDGLVTDSVIFGDPGVGEDPGDRLLQPGDVDVLCLEVELPLEVSDDLQGASARVALTAIAEQATEGL